MFRLPAEARWEYLTAHAEQCNIGQLVDHAIGAVEGENPALLDVFPREEVRGALDRSTPGKLLDLISKITLGDEDVPSREAVGHVFHYVLSQAAQTEGKKGDEFYTSSSLVKLLVAMTKPKRGIVYDPCCRCADTLLHAASFSDAHVTNDPSGDRWVADLTVSGQAQNHATWQLAKMNLIAHGLEGTIIHGDALQNDPDPRLKANYILAHPPFSISGWGRDRLKDDKRWRYGLPPAHSANFAWIQHILHHLAPKGVAAILLANNTMSSKHPSERKIRKALVEANVVDCMVALPGHIFPLMPDSACVWLLARDHGNDKCRRHKDKTLFIDAGNFGKKVGRRYRELQNDEIARIAGAYNSWRGEDAGRQYEDVSGFCRSVTLDEIRIHDHMLHPDIYVASPSR